MNYPRDQAIIPHLKCEKITPMQGNVAMTSELIERVALNLRLAGICHAHTHSVQIAQAAIAAIQADADLDRIKRRKQAAINRKAKP